MAETVPDGKPIRHLQANERSTWAGALTWWQESVAELSELVATARQAQQEGRWREAATRWRDVIWHAPDHPERGSFCASYGRCLLEAGDALQAVGLLAQVVKKYSGSAEALSSLALAYARNDAHDRAAALWNEVLTRFPGHRDLRWWLTSAAYSWLELGELDRAEEACRRAIAEDPHSPWGHAMLSVVAERRFHWEQALDDVERALRLCTGPQRVGLVVSQLRILGEMGEVAACRAVLAEELGHSPESPPLLAAAAQFATTQGPLAEAEERWARAAALCPDAPEIQIGRASLLRGTGRAAEAEALLRQCCMRWPRLAAPQRALAETCAFRRKPDAARQAWAEAARLAPLSIFRLWGQCAFLGSCGAREEAEALLSAAGAGGSVLWRGRFEYAKAARELDAALDCLCRLRQATPGDAELAYAEAEIRSWRQAQGDLEEAAKILRSQRDASPASVRTADLLLRVSVLQGQAEEAAAILQQLPTADARQGLCEARIWNEARRSDWPAMRLSWERLETRVFLPALHLPRADLRRVGGGLPEGAEGGILVVSMLRNERPRLPDFLAHYRRLGATGFALIDNDSRDGSVEYLAAQPDVILYATTESYAQSHYGIRWLNQVIDAHGRGWVLYADADERLVFAGSEQRKLQDLTRHLSARGEQIVPGVMIDMFPRRAGSAEEGRHEWFDPPQIRPSVTCPFIEAAGGARRRLFGTTVMLSKAPLVNAGQGIRYLSSHVATPGRVSAIRAALLHYHLDYLFDEARVGRLKDEVARGEHSDFAVDRRRSLAMARALATDDLTGRTSERYSGTTQLLRLGLITTTPDFDGGMI